MKPLAESSGSLAWSPVSSIRRDSVLRDGADIFGVVHWQSAFKAAALGGTASGEWNFVLEGFVFRQWIRVTPTGEKEPCAIFRASPSLNGVLELQGGKSYYWHSNFWLTKWIWSDEEGTDLLLFDRNLSLIAEGSLEIIPEAIPNPDVPLLSVLGWYLIVVVSDFRPG